MSERVIVRQDANFGTEFLATGESETSAKAPFKRVSHLHELTPYGMLLVSIGGCTAILLNSYAQNHKLPLERVVLELGFERAFQEDCENCESNDRYDEKISVQLQLEGRLSDAERQRLLKIARRCPIHVMVSEGMEVSLSLAETSA